MRSRLLVSLFNQKRSLAGKLTAMRPSKTTVGQLPYREICKSSETCIYSSIDRDKRFHMMWGPQVLNCDPNITELDAIHKGFAYLCFGEELKQAAIEAFRKAKELDSKKKYQNEYRHVIECGMNQVYEGVDKNCNYHKSYS